MALQRGTFVGTLVADAYRNLMDLLNLGVGGSANGVEVVGGILQALSQSATFRFVPRGSPAPATADAGTQLAAGAGIGFQATDMVRLDEVWVRNTTAGQNATLVFTGAVEV